MSAYGIDLDETECIYFMISISKWKFGKKLAI